MNNNQDTTLTNRDNFEAWGKLDKFQARRTECGTSYHDPIVAGGWAGWQAATKASEQRIQELEAEIKHLLADHLSHSDIYEQYCKMSEKKILELTASNNQLREAGQALVARWNTPNWKYAEHTATFIHAIQKALSSTPTQSLVEHDNEVIERCAVACESIRENEYCVDVRAGAEAIRALKVTL